MQTAAALAAAADGSGGCNYSSKIHKGVSNGLIKSSYIQYSDSEASEFEATRSRNDDEEYDCRGDDSERRRRPKVLEVLSKLLERIVALEDAKCDEKKRISDSRETEEEAGENANEANGTYEEGMTVFHGQRAPSISVEKYVERIFRYACCSPACFVVALAYLDRLHNRRYVSRVPPPESGGATPAAAELRRNQTHVPITSLTVHRLLITSVMVAAKFLDDRYFNNAFYAKIGGVSTMEMNRLELELLFRLGFRLHMTVETFDMYCTHLEQELASPTIFPLPPAPHSEDVQCETAHPHPHHHHHLLLRSPVLSSQV